MSNKINLSPENIQQVLGETSEERLVVLSFFSAQSPECIEQAAILDKLAGEYGQHLVIAILDCDIQQALAGQLAQQIGLQALPTLVLLKNAAPVDMLPGPQPESRIREALSEHLPKQHEVLLEQAKQALAKDDLNQAYTLAKQALEFEGSNSRIKLVLADICIQIHKLEDAQALIDSIAPENQDAYFTNIKAKCEQALEAKDSPAIKTLQSQVEQEPQNMEAKANLALAYNEAGRKEDALEALFGVLQKDMAFGEAKKLFLEIIASLPEGDAIASTYRRKLYSLLY